VLLQWQKPANAPYPKDFLLKIDALEKSVMAQTSPEKTEDPP